MSVGMGAVLHAIIQGPRIFPASVLPSSKISEQSNGFSMNSYQTRKERECERTCGRVILRLGSCYSRFLSVFHWLEVSDMVLPNIRGAGKCSLLLITVVVSIAAVMFTIIVIYCRISVKFIPCRVETR